jgi:hypothetical protein
LQSFPRPFALTSFTSLTFFFTGDIPLRIDEDAHLVPSDASALRVSGVGYAESLDGVFRDDFHERYV